MISRPATRIDLKHDDDMMELEDAHMQKLRAEKRTQAHQNSQAYLMSKSSPFHFAGMAGGSHGGVMGGDLDAHMQNRSGSGNVNIRNNGNS